MSSVLHFSPAFKHSLSHPDLPSSPRESSKKRKRGLEPLDRDDGDVSGEVLEAESAANATSLLSAYSNLLVTTSSAALNVDVLQGDNTLHSQNPNFNDHAGLRASNFPRSFPHHIPETAPSISKGRIGDELATLKPPLYVGTERVPTATAKRTSSSTGLRQQHLSAVTAILHRYLLEGDFMRAGRAWAMLLRAEHNGHSMDLRMHDRWGVGAEIIIQRESQMAQKTRDHSVVEISSSISDLRVKAESMKRAKEYYERVVLQYPYLKAFPNATGPLNFSIAMFSLWLYTVKERSAIAPMAAGTSDKDIIEETDAEASDEIQRSSVSEVEHDHYQKREQVKRDTLQDAREIATRLDGLLVSPPYSDNARFWKLCGETYLWIADLSVATIFPTYSSSISGDNEELTMGSPYLLKYVSRSTSSIEKNRIGQEREKALARAKEAFEKVKICGGI